MVYFAAGRAAFLDGGLALVRRGPETGEQLSRAMLYRLAVETGLRASELGSLTPASFDLQDLGDAAVTVGVNTRKTNRMATVP